MHEQATEAKPAEPPGTSHAPNSKGDGWNTGGGLVMRLISDLNLLLFGTPPPQLMDAGSAIDDRGASRRPLVRKRTSERSSAPTPPPLDVMLPPPPPRAPSFASCVPLEMEDPAHHGAPLPRGVPPLDAMRTSEPGRSRLDSSEPVDCESACLNLSRSEERSRPISAPAHPSARSLRPSQCRVHVVHARGQRRNVAGLHGRAGGDDRAHEGIVVERAP